MKIFDIISVVFLIVFLGSVFFYIAIPLCKTVATMFKEEYNRQLNQEDTPEDLEERK